MSFDPDAFLADEFDPDAFISEESQGVDFSSSEMVKNIPSSAGELAAGMWNAATHPVDTAENLGKLALGLAEKTVLAPAKGAAKLAELAANKFGDPQVAADASTRLEKMARLPQEKYAEAVGQHYIDRYGSIDNAKMTLMEDPVGALMDASIVLTGAGSLGAKLPGIAGKVGQTTAAVGKTINPLSIAGKVAKPVLKATGKGVSELVGGLGTHTGGESIRKAVSAGFRGGDVAEDFKGAMRGNLPMENVVSEAKIALQNMRKMRGDAYRSGMVDISKDKTVLSFKPVNKAIKEIEAIGKFKGQSISKSTTGTMQQIRDKITEWKQLDPNAFHTPEGMDALKKAIGDIRDSTDFGTPSRLIADRAYNAVKGQIIKQAPSYAKVMGDYEKGAKALREIEKSLSLGSKAGIDTSLRKLQSIMRNNANTNYGNRLDMVKQLEDAGAANITEKLAGQSLNTFAPRGLGKVLASGFGGAGLVTANPAYAIPIIAQSPRVMGELSYYGGRGANVLSGMENVLGRAGLSSKGLATGAYYADELDQSLLRK